MNQLIPSKDLPAPRLELRWTDERKDGGQYERQCNYNLVLPLREHDIRREEGSHEFVVNLGQTRSRSGRPAIRAEGEIHVPFRDGAHIQFDREALNPQLPMFVIDGEFAQQIAPNGAGMR